MEPTPTHNDWSDYQRLVLAELQRHNEALLVMSAQMTDIRIELSTVPSTVSRLVELEQLVAANSIAIAALKVQAGMWGALGGLIGALTLFLTHFLGH